MKDEAIVKEDSALTHAVFQAANRLLNTDVRNDYLDKQRQAVACAELRRALLNAGARDEW